MRLNLTRILVHAVLAMVGIMLLSILWVVLQMVAIDPGQPIDSYVGRALNFYLIAGVLILIVAAYFAARRLPRRDALATGAAVGLAYVLIELLIQLLTSGVAGTAWPLFLLSCLSKAIAERTTAINHRTGNTINLTETMEVT